MTKDCKTDHGCVLATVVCAGIAAVGGGLAAGTVSAATMGIMGGSKQEVFESLIYGLLSGG